MKPGTIIELPDGSIATVVYHGLDGYGIQWGKQQVDVEEILAGDGNANDPPPGYPWMPEAMLRDPYPSAVLPCVGEEYVVVGDRVKLRHWEL